MGKILLKMRGKSEGRRVRGRENERICVKKNMDRYSITMERLRMAIPWNASSI